MFLTKAGKRLMPSSSRLKSYILCTIVAVFAIFSNSQVHAQDAYTGNEFWLSYMPNNSTAGTMKMYFTAAAATVVTITYPGSVPLVQANVNVPANGIVQFDVQANVGGVLNGVPPANAVSKNGIQVTSPEPISVYVFSESLASAEAYIGIPLQSLGTNYITMSPEGGATGPASFMVVATEDNTNVTFTLPAGKAAVGRPAGSTWTVNLDKGETYFNENTGAAGLAGDLTGTVISANKKIAALSGAGCISFPGSASTNGYGSCGPCDHIIDQLTPVDTWGKKFVAADFVNGQLNQQNRSTYVRVITSDPGITTFDITGFPQQTLTGRGNYKDFLVDGGAYIESDKAIAAYAVYSGNTCYSPLLVTGFGDPSIIALVPEEQWGNRSPFVCPTTAPALPYTSVINIFAKSENPNVILDGVAQNNFTPIGATGFFYKHVAVNNGNHLATSDSANPFMIYAYGAGLAISYAYPAAGPSLKNLAKTLFAGYFNDTVCVGNPTAFTDTSLFEGTEIASWQWNFGDGNTSNAQNPAHTYAAAGNYNVQLLISDTAGSVDSTFKEVIVKALPNINISATPPSICEGDTVQLSANGGGSYSWTPTISLSDGNIANPRAFPTTSTMYELNVTGANGCTNMASINVAVTPKIDAGPDFSGEACIDVASFDLNQFRGPDNPDGGQWEIESGMPGTLTTAGILNTTTGVEGTHTLRYILLGQGDCASDTAILTLTNRPLPSGVLLPVDSVCLNAQANAVLNVTGEGSTFDIFYRINGTPFQSLGESSPFSITTIAQDPTNIVIDSIRTNNTKRCTSEPDLSTRVPIHLAPSISLVDETCSSDLTNYTVDFTVSGGNPASYTFTGTTPPILAGGVYTSQTYALVPYTISVTDKNNCEPVAQITGNKNCNCDTRVGSMNDITDTLSLCGMGSQSATHNGQEANDGNDAFEFILHTRPGSSVNPLPTIIQRSNTPTFSFDPATMTYGTVYYISAYTGDDNGNGEVDPDNVNGCNQLAQGRPVVWYETPSGNVNIANNPICEGNQSELNFMFTAGTAPYSVEYNRMPGGAQPTITGLSDGSSFALTGLNTGTYAYSDFQFTDANGCTFTFNNPQNLTVNEGITAQLDSMVCNGNNTAYTVYITLGGGTGNYRENNVTISLNANQQWVQSGVPNNSTFSYSFTDDNACNTVVVSATNNCACQTRAPFMANTSDTLSNCVGNNSIIAAVAPIGANGLPNGYNPDSDDTFSFVLCTDPDDPIGTMVDQSSISETPDFNFNNHPNLLPNTVYYISPVAGDQESNGNLVDLNAVCDNYFRPGTPVIWYSLPEISINLSANEICTGGSLNLNYTVNSPLPVNFTIIGSDGFTQNVTNANPGNGNPISISPSGTNTTITYSVDVSAGNEPRFTNAPGCVGTWDGNGPSVFINPVPTAEIITSDFSLCNGDFLPVTIANTGLGTVNITWNGGQPFSTTGHTDASVAIPSTRPMAASDYPEGQNTFSISSVSSVSSSGLTCSGTIVGNPLQVTVAPLPNYTASINPAEICFGEPVNYILIPTAGTAPFDITLGDNSLLTLSSNAPFTQSFIPRNDTVFSSVKISDSFIHQGGIGCEQDIIFDLPLTVRPLPVGQIQYQGSEVCQGESATLRYSISGNAPFTSTFNQIESGISSTFTQTGIPANSTQEYLATPNDTTAYTFNRVVDRFGCEATELLGFDSIFVNPLPIPVISSNLRESCPPLKTLVENSTLDLDNAQCEWDFGNGITFSGCDPDTIIYTLPQSYDISLKLTSDKGCTQTTIFPDYLTVHPFPIADFDVNGNELNNINTIVKFNNRSIGANSFEWDFGFEPSNSEAFTAFSPIVTYPQSDEEEQYTVGLKAESLFGCRDSIIKVIRFGLEIIAYVPNAFTPNDDGVNDGFRAYVKGIRTDDFILEVFNRWGERIFSTTDPEGEWDGTYNETLSPPDIYTWRMVVKKKGSGFKKSFEGRVTLLR